MKSGWFDSEEQNRKNDSINAVYVKNIKALKSLYRLNPSFDQFIKIKVLKNEPLYRHVIAHEILYKKGDSIAIQGKIVNGAIVPVLGVNLF